MKEPKPVSAFQPANESRNDLFTDFRKLRAELRDEIRSLKSDFTRSQQPQGPQFPRQSFPRRDRNVQVPLLTSVFSSPKLASAPESRQGSAKEDNCPRKWTSATESGQPPRKPLRMKLLQTMNHISLSNLLFLFNSALSPCRQQTFSV